ncbi:MAG: NYN domain-containing protein [Candidatus Campbellbacteria bacterium]|nr:NYN domain-containing protein [Candidatus Campbellbacteria bacterium]
MTIIKHKEQRVAVFIDAQNLYHSAKHLYKSKVNFGEVLDSAVAGRSLIRAIAYVITTETGEEKIFFEALEKLGIETKTKDLQIFYGGAKKADWDVGIAVDAIKLATKVDAVVICSGDGDFVPLVTYIQNKEGSQVEVMTFGKSASARLKEAADDFVDLDEESSKYLINDRRSRRGKKNSKNSRSPKK